jgi:hypothetical protein
MIVLGLTILWFATTVWAKPYNSAKDIQTATIKNVFDTTKSIIISKETKINSNISKVDTSAINAEFLNDMNRKGQLLSSNDFASRITDYYNTLVATLTALFVLFTIVTYLTIRSRFERKLEEKANEVQKDVDKFKIETEKELNKSIAEELSRMLSDSIKIKDIITGAVGGHIDDSIATHDEIDAVTEDLGKHDDSIKRIFIDIKDLKSKQSELYKVVAEIQDLRANSAKVEIDTPTNALESDNDKQFKTNE